MENKEAIRREPGTGLRTEHVLFSRRKRQLRDIYFHSFPKKERMPFGMMIAMSCLPTTKFLAFYDGETLCGLLYLAKLGKQAYLLFFAVDEALRSRGYGSWILSELRARWPGCRTAVSIEPCTEDAPDLPLRRRRKQFYLRNGFADSGYNIRLGGSDQELLMSGGAFHRLRFSVFLLLYSCLAIIPRLRRREN